MTSLAALIRAAYDSGERNPDVVAASVLNLALNDRGSAFEMLLPAVRDTASTELRRLVRGLEGRASLTEPASGFSDAALAARARLLSELVWVPNVGRRTWGSLTVEQHETVISYYGLMIDGLSKTIRRHEEAIVAIKGTPGATCLDDVPVRPRAHQQRGLAVRQPERQR